MPLVRLGDGLHPRRAGAAGRGGRRAREAVALIELNVSCPNVETGPSWAPTPTRPAAAVERLRPLTDKPLIVKLTPNATDPGAVAAAAEAAGADAVSLINTLKGMALHPGTRRAVARRADGRRVGSRGPRRRARAGGGGGRARRRSP